MRTLIATMVFPKGRKLVAKAAAKWEGETIRVEYAGELSQLKPFTDRGTLEFIEWYLRGIAGSYGAELTISVEGNYELRRGAAESVVLVAEDDANDFALINLAFRKNRSASRLVRAHNGRRHWIT
jgi:hypothetical protein